MKNRLTPLRMIAVGLGLATALTVTGHIWPAGQETARAQQAFAVGFDMNTAGNECPNNGTDCSVGPVDACVSVNPGDSFQFDVFMQGLPQGQNFSGFDFKIVWGPPDWLDITARIHNSPVINLVAQVPGSQVVDLSPQELPVLSSPHITSVIDFALPVGKYDEANPPYTQGVLGRYTGQVSADTEPGLYTLTFDPTFTAIYRAQPENLCMTYGCEVLDGYHSPRYGLVAVGEECPAGPTTPVPGTQPSPIATAPVATEPPTETAVASTVGPAATPTRAPGTAVAPSPVGANTPGSVSSDGDGTDWGSPIPIAMYVVAGFVGGLAVAGMTYLGTRRRRV